MTTRERLASTRVPAVAAAALLCAAGALRADDCNVNNIDDAVDIANGTSHDCNQNGVPDECDLYTLRFSPAPMLNVGSFAWSVLTADWDNDGDLDLAVGSSGWCSNRVTIFRNLGSGVFGPPTIYNSGGEATGLASGDFDGDGYLDLAFADGRLGLLRNLGNGNFAFVPGLPMTDGVGLVAAADMDGDGDLDLVFSNGPEMQGSGGFVGVWRNSGNGAFASAGIVPTGSAPPNSVAVGDLDGDGDIDVATANLFGTDVSILLNNGGGLLQLATNYPLGAEPSVIVAADLDGDGDTDLGVSESAASRLFVFRNSGDGTFIIQNSGPCPNVTLSLAAADFDNDGDLDLVGANVLGGAVLLRNNGGASFTLAGHYPAGTYPLGTAAGDLNGDGHTDVVIASEGDFCPMPGVVAILTNLASPPVSADCNANSIPDECDIAANPALDQNGDGIIDSCVGGPIMAANPPLDNPFLPGQSPYRDVLHTGTTGAGTQGIGGATTPPSGMIDDSHIRVRFSQPAVIWPSNISVACSFTGTPPGSTPCPTVLSVAGSGAGPYTLTLSGPIPPGGCTSFTFTSTTPTQVLRYESLPGDVNMNGQASGADVIALVLAVTHQTANLSANRPRYDINRSGSVNAADVMRLVQLLNGVNTTQAWSGVTLAPCS